MCENLKFVEINGMRVYNLTLHDITYISTQGEFIFPGNKEACVRVSQDYVSVEHPLGLNWQKNYYWLTRLQRRHFLSCFWFGS